MEDIQIIKQNFDRAKSVIKKFSNELPQNPRLNKFDEDTFFGMVSKNVTGKEMNGFVNKVQAAFIESNQASIKIIKEFKEIYNVFEVLDKQYIEYFESAIDNLKKVSGKAQQAGNDAIDAQKDIKRTVQALRQTIDQLSEYKVHSTERIDQLRAKIVLFENKIDGSLHQLERIEEIKEQIEGYKHFGDIDAIWADVQSHTSGIKAIHETIKAANSTLTGLQMHKMSVESIKHLTDVDTIWEDVKRHKSDIVKIDTSLGVIDANLLLLNNTKSEMAAIVHLKDIDSLWQDVQRQKKEIFEINTKVDSLFNKSGELDNKFSEAYTLMQEKINGNEEKMRNNLKIAYWIGGIALLSSIVQLILNNI